LIKKVWAKFDDLDLVCVCDEHHRKCKPDAECKEYVVKFMEIDRKDELEAATKHLTAEAKKLHTDMQRFQSKVSRSIKKFKI
jgi:hypothetical protein